MDYQGTDEELAASAQQGSLPAFAELVRRYERKIFSYLYRFTNQREDAEDIAQDVFLKVYTHFSSFNIEKKFSTWIYTIATRTAYDWLRRKRRRGTTIALDEELETIETISADKSYEIIEASIDLERVLAKLKPRHRVVLLLFYQQDFSYADIAAALGIPLNTVKTHLHRARAALIQAASNHN